MEYTVHVCVQISMVLGELAALAALAALAITRTACASGMGGMGDGLHDMYIGGLVASSAIPEYTMNYTGGGLEHGLQWELPLVYGPGSRETVVVHSTAASFSYYPGSRRSSGRLTQRVWFVLDDMVAVGVGAGGFVHRDGSGPRIESRLLYGIAAEGVLAGLYLGAAYEPDVARQTHGGEATVGLVVPLHTALF